MKDELGDKIKKYESVPYWDRLSSTLPVICRLDGRSFHSFTKNMQRPFDPRLERLMDITLLNMMKETNALIGYTQSDEFTLLLYADDPKSQIYFDGRVQKITSVLAAFCTAIFSRGYPDYFYEDNPITPLFDCRVFNVPSKKDAIEVFKWREEDAVRNSVQMLARHHFSHKECYKKSTKKLINMLHDKGIQWSHFPSRSKSGQLYQKYTLNRAFTTDELIKLPLNHTARTNPYLMVERSDYRTINNRISDIKNIEDVFFNKEEVNE